MRMRTGMIVMLGVVLVAVVAIHGSRAAGNAPSEQKPLAAPLPKPVLKTHFNSGSGKYVFESRKADLARLKQAFNTVIVNDADPKLIDDVRAAGLAAIVEFDEKDDFVKGKSVEPTVNAIIQQVKSNPGTISGIRVADRVNQRLTPDQAIAYLKATGGVFHSQIPGVPVLVDVTDWELTCGLPGQTSCRAHANDEYRYCTNDILTRIYKSGLVDGFEVAVNLKDDDADAMAKAMSRAREMFPSPFLLYSRSASLSFDEDNYSGDDQQARRQVAAFIEAPLKAGIDGIDLWAWHRPWKNELRTFLNKDGSDNPLWNEMVRVGAAATSAANR